MSIICRLLRSNTGKSFAPSGAATPTEQRNWFGSTIRVHSGRISGIRDKKRMRNDKADRSVVGSAAFQRDLVGVAGPRFANPAHVLARTRITSVSLTTPLPCFQDGPWKTYVPRVLPLRRNHPWLSFVVALRQGWPSNTKRKCDNDRTRQSAAFTSRKTDCGQARWRLWSRVRVRGRSECFPGA